MTKGSGKRLSDAEQMQIIQMLASPNLSKMRKLAQDFGVDEGSIQYVNKNHDAIKARNAITSQSTRQIMYQQAQPKFPELEEILLEWLSACRRMSLAISPSLVKAKVAEIASKLDIAEGSFSASNGWLHRFHKQNDIRGAHLFGEGGEVDKNDPELLRTLEQLETLIDTYDIENVYNMDETGLFFSMDDESDAIYQQSILEDINDIIERAEKNSS